MNIEIFSLVVAFIQPLMVENVNLMRNSFYFSFSE